MSEVLQYAAYAPPETRCARCGYRVGSDQLVSRVTLSGEVGYQHLQYSECKKAVKSRLAELEG